MKFTGLILFAFCLFLFSCTFEVGKETNTQTADTVAAKESVSNDQNNNVNNPATTPVSSAVIDSFEVRTFMNQGAPGGYGYDVLMGGKIYIHQPHIPAVAGNNGFPSAESALKTGTFIVTKIRKNIMPPSVTKDELDSLGVL